MQDTIKRSWELLNRPKSPVFSELFLDRLLRIDQKERLDNSYKGLTNNSRITCRIWKIWQTARIHKRKIWQTTCRIHTVRGDFHCWTPTDYVYTRKYNPTPVSRCEEDDSILLMVKSRERISYNNWWSSIARKIETKKTSSVSNDQTISLLSFAEVFSSDTRQNGHRVIVRYGYGLGVQHSSRAAFNYS